MKLQFKVVSVSEEEVPVTVKVGDKPVVMKAAGLVVELQALDESTTHTHRFGPGDLEEARELFTQGKTVTFNAKAE
jgi:hypothetical protein